MKEKKLKKRSRKHHALRCLKWIVILLVFNVVFHGIPFFIFQARNAMEIQYGLEPTHVIWEEEADRGRWDGDFLCMSAEDTTAIFYNMHFTWEGWTSSVLGLIDRNTTKPLSATWCGSHHGGEQGSIWAVGCVASSQVVDVEYCLIWNDDSTEMHLISEKDFVHDNGNRYYIYDTGAPMYYREPVSGSISVKIVDVVVTARDAAGQILYQENILPSWG